VTVRDRIKCVRGNIVTQEVDAVVNAANSHLREGYGVCGAIFTAAGPALERACNSIGVCPTGEARITEGFWMPARYIIHAVGPVFGECDGRDEEFLSSAYRSSLALSVEHSCSTVAFPAISTGIYGYPKHEAAEVAVATVCEWLANHELPHAVFFVLFTAQDLEIYEKLVGELP
jgi:O-acetyl-ADP-ribose deacetylase